jgi:hypothetical protein
MDKKIILKYFYQKIELKELREERKEDKKKEKKNLSKGILILINSYQL